MWYRAFRHASIILNWMLWYWISKLEGHFSRKETKACLWKKFFFKLCIPLEICWYLLKVILLIFMKIFFVIIKFWQQNLSYINASLRANIWLLLNESLKNLFWNSRARHHFNVNLMACHNCHITVITINCVARVYHIESFQNLPLLKQKKLNLSTNLETTFQESKSLYELRQDEYPSLLSLNLNP